MKKTLSLILAAALALSLAACGNGGSSSSGKQDASSSQPGSQSSSTSGSGAGSTSGSGDQSAPETDPDPEPQLTAAKIGEKVTLDFVEFTTDDFGHGENIKDGRTTMSFPIDSGCEAFWLHGTLTNTSGSAFDLYNGYVKIIFDDTYEYEGTVRNPGGDAAPLADTSFYLCASVPPKAFENAQKIVVQFAFNENFGEYDGDWSSRSPASYDYAYELVQDGSSSQAADVDADTIDAALQGSWTVGGGTFDFNSGAVVITNQGQVMTGTYEIDTENSSIKGSFTATNGVVNITMPYKYADGTLNVYNNAGEALEKK